jgi:hypothetical protein
LVWFADDMPNLPHIVNEITKFPKFKYKDFLDTLTDQAQSGTSKDGIDHQTDIPGQADRAPDPMNLSRGSRFLGFDPVTKQPQYSDSKDDDVREAIFGTEQFWHDNMTGAL